MEHTHPVPQGMWSRSMHFFLSLPSSRVTGTAAVKAPISASPECLSQERKNWLLTLIRFHPFLNKLTTSSSRLLSTIEVVIRSTRRGPCVQAQAAKLHFWVSQRLRVILKGAGGSQGSPTADDTSLPKETQLSKYPSPILAL